MLIGLHYNTPPQDEIVDYITIHLHRMNIGKHYNTPPQDEYWKTLQYTSTG
jgi:hypothetical protein